MITLLIILQCILVFIICVAVLLQKSSSIGLGAYSGSNESLFGTKGPAGFLAKFTFVMGFLLIINTISLSYLYNTQADSSLVEKINIENAIPQAPTSTQPIPQAPNASTETNSSN